MSTQDPMGGGRQPSEEELRAAYEEELKRISVDDVIVQTVVSLLNLGGRRAGLAPGTEGERDLDQVRAAIDGARALLPIVEGSLGQDAGPLRDALSQLQMAYVRLGGEQGGGGEGEPARPEETRREAPSEERPQQQPPGQGGTGPAQQSGRLWVPGQ